MTITLRNTGAARVRDPEFKAAWLAALRDPEAKQTSGLLERTAPKAFAPAGNCCLGVACRVSGLETRERGDFVTFIDSGGSPMNSVLSIPFKKELFYGTESEVDNAMCNLMDMNDKMEDGEHLYTFADIADYIEANL